jgi:hypothetical protein
MIAIWEESGYADPVPELPAAFGQLRARCAAQREENGHD